MSANERQVGGDHYKSGGEEHWDRAYRLGLDYFQATATAYIERCWKKNGIEDLKKARHFLDKYIELKEKEQSEMVAKMAAKPYFGLDEGAEPGPGYVNQDR